MPVSAAAVLLLGVVGTRSVVTMADARCAPENMIGGACVEPWQTSLVEVSIYAAVVVMSLGLTLIPAAFAPQLKRSISIIGGLISLAPLGFIYYLSGWPELAMPILVAVLVSAFGIFRVWSWRSNNAID